MKRSIGLFGASATLVGLVVGASIFLMPGKLAASAGPGVALAYSFTGFVALLSCVVAAQIGALFPVSGASFVSISTILSPIYGFLLSWISLGSAAMSAAFVAYGFADYLLVLLPSLDRTAVALGIVLLFSGLNLLGAHISVAGQSGLVIMFMLVLLVFGVVGIANIDVDLLTPIAPYGPGSVFSAAVPAFYSFTGLFLIIELGGEIKNPTRTIPLAILISFAVILTCYLSMSTVIVGILDSDELLRFETPVAEIAHRLFPPWSSTALILTIMIAAATSVNGILLAYSRNILALARARILPEGLARIDPTYQQPRNAVLVMTGLTIVAISFKGTLIQYAGVTVIKYMLLHILASIAVLIKVREHESNNSAAGLLFSGSTLVVICAALIGFSILYLGLGVIDQPVIFMVATAMVLSGIAAYHIRNHYLLQTGISIKALIEREVKAGHELSAVPAVEQT